MVGKPALIDEAGEAWYLAAQAAQRLGVGTTRFHKLVNKGRLPSRPNPDGKLGRIYPERAIDALRAELQESIYRPKKATAA